MKRLHIFKASLLGPLGLSLALIPFITDQSAAQSRVRNASLEVGTVLPARLTQELRSDTARAGDKFTATLSPDYDSDRLPQGTVFQGVVVRAEPQRNKEPGLLELDFRRMRLPDGHSYPMEGAVIGLDNKSVEHGENGQLIAKPGKRTDRLTYVGYGAGAGLLVSVLTGSKNTFRDTLLGGGLGYLFGALEKGNTRPRNVVLKSGTELGVRIDQNLYYAWTADTSARLDDPRFPIRDSDRNREDGLRGDRDFHQDAQPAQDSDEADSISVLIGDRDVTFNNSVYPMRMGGVLMVPARRVLGEAGVRNAYNARRQTLTAYGSEGPVRVTIGSRVAVVNGDQRVTLEGPARLRNDVVYVPVRFLELATGRRADFDRETRTITLSPREAP